MSQTEKRAVKKVESISTKPKETIYSKTKKILGKKKSIVSEKALTKKDVTKAIELLNKKDSPITPTPNQGRRLQAKAKHIVEEAELKVHSSLNPKQEKFCQLYATDREFFGNGTQSYIEAYNPDMSKPNWYKSAQASSSRMLSNVIIIESINEILEKTGLNDVAVDKQTSFLIHQHADFTNKLGAIREYNKIKDRYPKQKIEVAHSFDAVEIERFASKDSK